MHGIIINLSSNTPLTFTFNPEEVRTKKDITYFIAPNIGGASKEAFFSGFNNREVELQLETIDKVSPFGVRPIVDFFEALGEPDPGLLGIAGSFFGNENYPPPKVLYQFGVSLVPLVYEIARSPDISISEFKDGEVAGVIGIPTRARIGLSLRLDEQHVMNQANQIAKKVSSIAGAAESILKEGFHISLGTRKEAPFG